MNNTIDDLTYFLTQHESVVGSYDLFGDKSVLLISEVFKNYIEELEFDIHIDPEEYSAT